MVNWSRVREVGKRIMFGPSTINGKPVVNLVTPLGPKVMSGAGSILSTIAKGAKNLVSTRALAPAMGTSQPILNTLKKAATGAGIGITSYGAYSAVKGVQESNAPNILKAATSGAGLAVSPVGSTLGFLSGTGTMTANQIKTKVQNLFGLGKSRIEDATNIFKGLPNPINQQPNINITLPDISRGTMPDLIPQLPQTIYFESPQTPSLSYATNPSFSLGGVGGMGDNLPLMLMMMMGVTGAGGYLLGKRKKKRYKKKRKHK